MKENLDYALDKILLFEGGYAERATEPGGAVMRGVSFQTFEQWRRAHGDPEPTFADLKNMSVDETKQIYTVQYSAAIGFNDTPAGLDFCDLDSSVNEGIGGTLRFMALGAHYKYTTWLPHLDELIPVIKGNNDIPGLIDFVCNIRLENKKKRKEWERFGKGWSLRIEQVREHAKELYQNSLSTK